jgi:hypothetical protein
MPDTDGSRGYMNHLTELGNFDRGSRLLSAAISSVSLAGLANVRSAPAVMANARVEYTSALRLVNAALRDPAQVKTDSTLTSVILLSLFEVTGSSFH